MSTTVATAKMLDLAQLEAAPLHMKPFEYLTVDDVLHADSKAAIIEGFPNVDRNGSFPLSTLRPGPGFRQLVDELLSKEFEIAVGKKFSMD